MEDEQEALPRLRALGLSEYAARAYLALLKLGKSDARSVSALARVPPSKVYDVLAVLEEAGLLEVFPEFPKKYGPLSLEKRIDGIVQEHREAAERIERERGDLLRAFAPATSPQGAEETSVTTLRGRTRILERMHEMLGGAQSSWLALASLHAAARMPQFMGEIAEAHKRGVEMRFILQRQATPAPLLDALSALSQVKRCEPSGTRSDHVTLVVADGQRALLVHWASDAGAPGAADSAIATSDAAMVGALESLFHAAWSADAPLRSSA